MTRIPAVVLIVMILSARALGLSAQDPCDALQAKLDAAPPGAVVYATDFVGLFECSAITIRKPVTLVSGFFGDPKGLGGIQGPPITLDGPGRGTVTLISCTTSGLTGFAGRWVAPGISGGGFDTLHLYSCSIQALSYCGYGYGATGECATSYCCQGSEGSPAIAVSVGTTIIEDSYVEASAAASGGCARVAGCAGVLAEGGVVIVINSSVHGGNAGNYYLPGPDRPCDPNERRTSNVAGGAAVRCLELMSRGSTLAGGRGASWTRIAETTCPDPPVTYSYFCYQSPDGPPAVTGVQRQGTSRKGGKQSIDRMRK
mgnify:CR=1 FL=1